MDCLRRPHEMAEMMIRSRGFRADPAGFRWTAAHVVAVTLVVTAVFAAPWAVLVASASSARAQSLTLASPSPAPVKFYIVPPARNGHAESLFDIAAATLRYGSRYIQIFNLNVGRLQPDGERLENPGVIEPGWILHLPADAAGPGVRFGLLPGPAPSPTAPASHRPARPGPAGASAPASAFGWLGTGSAIVAGGALVLLTTTGLAVRFGRRRRTSATGRRRRGGAKRPGPPVSGRTAPAATAGLSTHTAGTHDTGTHAAGTHAAGQRWAQVPSESSWPDWGPPPELHPDHPSAPVPRVRVPVSRGESAATPPGGPPDREQRWSAQPARTPGAATQTHAEVASGDGRPRAVLTGAPATRWEGATDFGARAQGVVQVARGAVDLAGPVRWETSEVRNADPAWLAVRFLSVADAKAAEITREASGQATAIRAAAERDAAEIRRQASEHATAIRAAAEWDAAEARTAVMTMSAELGQVAAYVTENLTSPVAPARRPEVRPATKPEVRPTRTPAAQPTRKPESRPRQYAAMRLTAAVMAAMLLVAVTAGSTELALHGYRFFVFRSAGTGATSGDGLKENQGPGQPDAPGAHHQAREAHHQRSGHGPSTSGGGSHG
jgi:hypothetical protein